jgi:hypothetical protein
MVEGGWRRKKNVKGIWKEEKVRGELKVGRKPEENVGKRYEACAAIRPLKSCTLFS